MAITTAAELDAWSALLISPDGDMFEVEDLLAAFRPKWMLRAACRGQGTAVFFQGTGTTDESWRDACAGCEVQGDCLDYALADPSMMANWAGTSGRDRIRMRRAA